MYAHCIFCKAHLGRNEVVELFPIGRRLAFDEARGRLWAVCVRCGRWNLTPIEERWEAIEQCERLFRESRRRVSTEQVGLARLSEGLELVRVGAPQRPELAAWRYGRHFLRRRRRNQFEAMAPSGIALAMGAVALPLYWPLAIGGAAWEFHRSRRVVARVSDDAGAPIVLRPKHARDVRLVESDGEHGWALRMPAGGGRIIERSGDEALRLAGALLPHVNRKGAPPALVEASVAELESAGSAEAFFRSAAVKVRKHEVWALWKPFEFRLEKAPTEIRLALEMAAHEESERRALEGELAQLEHAWREAEEIAGIADNLLVPAHIAAAVQRLRDR
jgi:hypothetical protein